MPGKKIELTTDLLIGQSTEMSSLSSEYKELFANISYTLKDANNNWCPNLSKNFSGKITSANRSFSDIVSMLNAGAAAARNSANTMDNLDQNLAKEMRGDSISNPNGGASGSTSSSSKPKTKLDKFKELLSQIGDEYKQAWKEAQDFVEWYDSLPGPVKHTVDDVLHIIDPTGTLNESWQIVQDVLKADSALGVADVLVEEIGNIIGKEVAKKGGWLTLLGYGIRGQTKAWKPSYVMEDLNRIKDQMFKYSNYIIEDVQSGNLEMALHDSFALTGCIIDVVVDPANATQATVYALGYAISDLNSIMGTPNSVANVANNIVNIANGDPIVDTPDIPYLPTSIINQTADAVNGFDSRKFKYLVMDSEREAFKIITESKKK